MKMYTTDVCHSQIVNEVTQTQGFVARGDIKKEIIVAFAGTEQIEDALTGAYRSS